ncbi:MAG: hypothetical protein HY320_15775 [Armatimonadetes bacterium]|nr:hypothetical protein [Armatimonadota bacterium]
MTPEATLRTKIARLQQRVRWLVVQRWATLGLIAGLAAATVLAAVARLRWWTAAEDWLWAAALAGLLIGGALGLTRRISAAAVAWLADQRLGLKDRLSTGLEFSASPSPEPIVAALLANAAAHAQQVHPKQVFPWAPPREWRWLAVAAALFLAVLILPGLAVFQSPQARAEEAVIKEEGEKLQQLARNLECQAKESDANREIMRRIAQNLGRLGREQARGRLSKKQAMLSARQMLNELEEAQRTMGVEGARRTFADMAQELEGEAERVRTAGREQPARALEEMARALRSGDMAAAQRQLEENARALENSRNSAADLQRQADTLERMAGALRDSHMAPVGQQMARAAQELRQAERQAQALQQQAARADSAAQRQQLRQQAGQRLQQGAQRAARIARQAGGT